MCFFRFVYLPFLSDDSRGKKLSVFFSLLKSTSVHWNVFVFVKSEVVFALHQAGHPPLRDPDNDKQKRMDVKKKKKHVHIMSAHYNVLVCVDTVICSFLMSQITFPSQLLQKPKMLSLFSFRKYNQWVIYWFEAVQVFIWKSPRPFNFEQ